jgi:hypothetical protein
VAEWYKGSVLLSHHHTDNGRKQWGWPQWFRFWIFRLSLDILLVLMVALCTVQRDFIHAAYLALTLYLFRQRDALRQKGNELFFWLAFANLSVIILMLIFQAPWQEVLDWFSHNSVLHHSTSLHTLLQSTFAAVLNTLSGTASHSATLN